MTPGHETPGAMTPGRGATPSNKRNRWDETPKTDRGETPGRAGAWAETPRTDRGGGADGTDRDPIQVSVTRYLRNVENKPDRATIKPNGRLDGPTDGETFSLKCVDLSQKIRKVKYRKCLQTGP